MKIFCFHWKSGSSNLLVERIYSIVALRTFLLASVSNELLPKRRVFIKTGSQRSTRLLSMLTRVLRRVRLSIIYVGQWRRKCAVDSISKPSCSLVINLIPLGLWQLKRLLGDGLINFRILVLKILRLLEFLILWSRLFHSIIVDGKKQFWKKCVLF